MFTSLRARLIASYIAIILICLVLVSLVSIFLLSRFRARLVFSGLADAAVPTARWVSSLLQRDLTPVEIVELLKEQAEKQEVRILLLTRRGQVLVDTQDDWTGKQARVRPGRNPQRPQDTLCPRQSDHPQRRHPALCCPTSNPLRLAAKSGESQRLEEVHFISF